MINWCCNKYYIKHDILPKQMLLINVAHFTLLQADPYFVTSFIIICCNILFILCLCGEYVEILLSCVNLFICKITNE